MPSHEKGNVAHPSRRPRTAEGTLGVPSPEGEFPQRPCRFPRHAVSLRLGPPSALPSLHLFPRPHMHRNLVSVSFPATTRGRGPAGVETDAEGSRRDSWSSTTNARNSTAEVAKRWGPRVARKTPATPGRVQGRLEGGAKDILVTLAGGRKQTKLSSGKKSPVVDQLRSPRIPSGGRFRS